MLKRFVIINRDLEDIWKSRAKFLIQGSEMMQGSKAACVSKIPAFFFEIPLIKILYLSKKSTWIFCKIKQDI